MGRVMELAEFVTRVRAAIIQTAANMNLGGTQSESKNFGIFMLKNPHTNEMSMTALVAADPTVLSQVTINGDLANVDNVTDDAIRAVVTAKWGVVATKYPVTLPTP